LKLNLTPEYIIVDGNRPLNGKLGMKQKTGKIFNTEEIELLKSIPNILKDLGYDMLYLHTKLINYYDKFGWKKLMPFIKDDGIERNIYIFKI
jgi:hypothetical protein